jgi:hypothetical protein
VEFVPRALVMLDEERGVLIDNDGHKYPFDIYNTFSIKAKVVPGLKGENQNCFLNDGNTIANKASKLLTMKLNGILPEPGVIESSSIGRRIIFVTENRDCIIEKRLN